MSRLDFVCEIGTEELPANVLPKLGQSFHDNVVAGLNKLKLEFNDSKWFATPRRIAVQIDGLITELAGKDVSKRGPAVAHAFDDNGQPKPAATGFAQSCGVALEELERLKTEKGEWLVHHYHQPGLSTLSLLPEIIQKAVKTLPTGRTMRWGDKNDEFLRPVAWLLMMLGDDVVDASLFGIQSGNITYGHRFHHPQAIEIQSASDYAGQLNAKAHVMANFAERREAIRESAMALAAAEGGHAIIDEKLLSEVTGLCEWPVALLGHFDKAFLTVPAEGLVAAMQNHQKCFPVANDKLMPSFILVSNIDSEDKARVVDGNERVMRARLADAAFFYEIDCKQSLEDYLPKLKTVTYQEKLGSMHDKAVRVSVLAHAIASRLDEDAMMAERAGLLAKCDLATDMVQEFPELQGTMGRYYAEHSNEPDAVALAIAEHYMPRSAKGELPATTLGCAVAIADKLDTLVGIFGIDAAPTGEKDPFALRRAALGLVRIIIDKKLTLDLDALLKQAVHAYGDIQLVPDLIANVKQFIIERLRAWYLEKGMPADVIAAVLARQDNDFADFASRVTAVQKFREQTQAAALASANKRVSKLLQKQSNADELQMNDALFELDAEKELAQHVKNREQELAPLFAAGKYQEALSELSKLQEPVDKFFDDVMVMVEEEDMRNNRLALLNALRGLFLQVADISLLQ